MRGLQVDGEGIAEVTSPEGKESGLGRDTDGFRDSGKLFSRCENRDSGGQHFFSLIRKDQHGLQQKTPLGHVRQEPLSEAGVARDNIFRRLVSEQGWHADEV